MPYWKSALSTRWPQTCLRANINLVSDKADGDDSWLPLRQFSNLGVIYHLGKMTRRLFSPFLSFHNHRLMHQLSPPEWDDHSVQTASAVLRPGVKMFFRHSSTIFTHRMPCVFNLFTMRVAILTQQRRSGNHCGQFKVGRMGTSRVGSKHGSSSPGCGAHVQARIWQTAYRLLIGGVTELIYCSSYYERVRHSLLLDASKHKYWSHNVFDSWHDNIYNYLP